MKQLQYGTNNKIIYVIDNNFFFISVIDNNYFYDSTSTHFI